MCRSWRDRRKRCRILVFVLLLFETRWDVVVDMLISSKTPYRSREFFKTLRRVGWINRVQRLLAQREGLVSRVPEGLEAREERVLE